LLDAYIRRKRWEYREQAIAHFNLYGELTSKKSTAPIQTQPVTSGIGKNNGAPPLAALAKLGFDIS